MSFLQSQVGPAESIRRVPKSINKLPSFLAASSPVRFQLLIFLLVFEVLSVGCLSFCLACNGVCDTTTLNESPLCRLTIKFIPTAIERLPLDLIANICSPNQRPQAFG